MAATRSACAGLLLAAGLAQGAILPEERGDAMYHRYDGGGVTVDGPAVLVRKNFKETYSVNATYYVDNVSSASIDVITTGASPYGETRTEYSVGGDHFFSDARWAVTDALSIAGDVTYSFENENVPVWRVGASMRHGPRLRTFLDYTEIDRLQSQLGTKVELAQTLVFDHPRIADLARFLHRTLEADDKREKATASQPKDRSSSQTVASIDEMSEQEALEALIREIDE